MAEIKNLVKVSRRLKKAIKEGERIVLFSDSDLDGVTSLLILEESLKSLGAQEIFVYFPDRGEEGYGLTDFALKHLLKYSPALLVMTDCGVGNLREVEKARAAGFEIIILDHHEIIGDLPKAVLIVNPKQPADKYPFKFLSACGICFKLAGKLLGREFADLMRKNLLELATLGTIADRMPLEKDNKNIIDEGLKEIGLTVRPAFQVFFEEFSLERYSLAEIIQKMVSLMQITAVKNHLTRSYQFLSSSNQEEAKKILQELIQESFERQEIIKQFYEEVDEAVSGKSGDFIFWGSDKFSFSLTGSLATRICAKFKKPSFIFAEKNNLARGSVRAPLGFNSVQALQYCSSLLLTYGGHPPAAGFTLEKKNLEKFRQCLEEYSQKIKKEKCSPEKKKGLKK